MTVNQYRCVHEVEAMRWMDLDENREAFAAWFESHDAMFETRGSVVCLPEGGEASEGEWILFDGDDFLVMDDESFRDSYAEVTP